MVRAQDFALGDEELTLELIELLLQQVALGSHDAQFAYQRCIALSGSSLCRVASVSAFCKAANSWAEDI